MKIIGFPGIGERDWPEVEEAIRVTLAIAKAPQAAIDEVCRDLRPRWLAIHQGRKFDFGPVAPETAKAIEDVVAVFQGYLKAALAEMVQLEIDLFFARYGGKPPKAPFKLAA